MKRKFLFLLLSVFILASLTGCREDSSISTGKYYLLDTDECYIEIYEDNKISFVNVDFTLINESLKNSYELELRVEDILPDICTYDTNEEFDKLYVQLMGEVFITIVYSKDNETLQLMSKIYYLDRGDDT